MTKEFTVGHVTALDNAPPDNMTAIPDVAPSLTMPVDPAQSARMMMVALDPLLRKLPYEQRTSILLNLLVTYAAELPAAQAHRGKFINGMVVEFRKRLQMFLPL